MSPISHTRRDQRLPGRPQHWDQSAALCQTALAAARRAGDRLGEADTLAELGALQRETGAYPAAAASLARAWRSTATSVTSPVRLTPSTN